MASGSVCWSGNACSVGLSQRVQFHYSSFSICITSPAAAAMCGRPTENLRQKLPNSISIVQDNFYDHRRSVEMP